MRGLVRLMRSRRNVLRAVCDIVPEKVERVQKQVADAGFKKPSG